jgi:hypothetical protein
MSGHLWPASSYESIATVSASGNPASLSFNSIPSTYTHLQIRGIVKVNPSGNPILRFNSDSGANYTFHQLVGDGTSVSSSGGSGQTFIYQPYTLSTGFMAMVIDILDYGNTNKFKTVRTLGGNDNNNSGYSPTEFMSGLWRSTSAITDISLLGNGSTFSQYTSIALYGIKVAP